MFVVLIFFAKKSFCTRDSEGSRTLRCGHPTVGRALIQQPEPDDSGNLHHVWHLDLRARRREQLCREEPSNTAGHTAAAVTPLWHRC